MALLDLERNEKLFGGKFPTLIRARLFQYDFTRWDTPWAQKIPGAMMVPLLAWLGGGGGSDGKPIAKHENGESSSAWWNRSGDGSMYIPPIRKDDPQLLEFLRKSGWGVAAVPASREERCRWGSGVRSGASGVVYT